MPLILSRQVNQKVLIGDNISIKVCAIRGSRIKLWIDAPDDISIMREEIALTPITTKTEGAAGNAEKSA